RCIILYQAFNRCSYTIEPSCTWDSTISERWNTPAREISLFPSGGTFPRVGFCNSCAVDPSRAWDSVILERWTLPARGIPRFLSGGRLLRVGFGDSWAVDLSRAWERPISE